MSKYKQKDFQIHEYKF